MYRCIDECGVERLSSVKAIYDDGCYGELLAHVQLCITMRRYYISRSGTCTVNDVVIKPPKCCMFLTGELLSLDNVAIIHDITDSRCRGYSISSNIIIYGLSEEDAVSVMKKISDIVYRAMYPHLATKVDHSYSTSIEDEECVHPAYIADSNRGLLMILTTLFHEYSILISVSNHMSLSRLLYNIPLQHNQVALTRTGGYCTPMHLICADIGMSIADYGEIYYEDIRGTDMIMLPLLPSLADTITYYKLHSVRILTRETCYSDNRSSCVQLIINSSTDIIDYISEAVVGSRTDDRRSCNILREAYPSCITSPYNEGSTLAEAVNNYISRFRGSNYMKITNSVKYRYLPSNPQSILLFLLGNRYDNNSYHHHLPPEVIELIIQKLILRQV